MSIINVFFTDIYLDNLLEQNKFDEILTLMLSSLKQYELIINKQTYWKRKTLELPSYVENKEVKNWFYEYQHQRYRRIFSKGENRFEHLRTNNEPYIEYILDEYNDHLYKLYGINNEINFPIIDIIPGLESTLFISHKEGKQICYGIGKNNFLDPLNEEMITNMEHKLDYGYNEIKFPFIIKKCIYLAEYDQEVLLKHDSHGYFYLTDDNKIYFNNKLCYDSNIDTNDNFIIKDFMINHKELLIYEENDKGSIFHNINFEIDFQTKLIINTESLNVIVIPNEIMIEKFFFILENSHVQQQYKIYVLGYDKLSDEKDKQIYVCYTAMRVWFKISFNLKIKDLFVNNSDFIITTVLNEVFLYSNEPLKSGRFETKLDKNFPPQIDFINFNFNPSKINNIDDIIVLNQPRYENVNFITSTNSNLVIKMELSNSRLVGLGLRNEQNDYDSSGNFTRRNLVVLLFDDVDKIYMSSHLACGIFGVKYGDIEVNFETYLLVTIRKLVVKSKLLVRKLHPLIGYIYEDKIEAINEDNEGTFINSQDEYMVICYINRSFPYYTFFTRIIYTNKQIQPYYEY